MILSDIGKGRHYKIVSSELTSQEKSYKSKFIIFLFLATVMKLQATKERQCTQNELGGIRTVLSL